jgi:hypothetical protein
MIGGADFGKLTFTEATLQKSLIDSTVMRKMKWLFVSGCKCKSAISDPKEFLKSYQGGTNILVFLRIMLKIIYCSKINELDLIL